MRYNSVHNITRSMQGIFGASVSEFYLLIKSLINIGRAVGLCAIIKIYTAYAGTVSQGYTSMLHTGMVQHMLQVVKVALTDDTTLAIFLFFYNNSVIKDKEYRYIAIG